MGSIKLSNKISELSKLELLQRANDYIFSTGLNDGASKLCKANMKYGLAQFHLIQEKYGFEPKATFISSPDETSGIVRGQIMHLHLHLLKKHLKINC